MQVQKSQLSAAALLVIMAPVLILSFLAAVFCSAQSEQPLYREVYPPLNLSDSRIELRSHLFFALVQSFGVQFNGSGNIAGVKVALDRINNSTDILPGYTLHYTLTDSQVSLD